MFSAIIIFMFRKMIILLCVFFLLGSIFYVLLETRTPQAPATEANANQDNIEKTYYFGYGSNMDINLLKRRIGNDSIAPISYAVLEDYRLVFPRGLGSVIPDENSDVYGCLYFLTKEEIAKLDIVEGYKEGRDKSQNSYNREWIDVLTPDGNIISAEIYIQSDNSDVNSKPSEGYKQTLVNGARQCLLPEFYIQGLEEIETN